MKFKVKLKDIRGDGLSVLYKMEEDLREVMLVYGLVMMLLSGGVMYLDLMLEVLKVCLVCCGMLESVLVMFRLWAKIVVVRSKERVGESVARDELIVLVDGEVDL